MELLFVDPGCMALEYVGVAKGAQDGDLFPQFFEVCLLVNPNLIPCHLDSTITIDGTVDDLVSTPAQFIVELRRQLRKHPLVHLKFSLNLRTKCAYNAMKLRNEGKKRVQILRATSQRCWRPSGNRKTPHYSKTPGMRDSWANLPVDVMSTRGEAQKGLLCLPSQSIDNAGV